MRHVARGIALLTCSRPYHFADLRGDSAKQLVPAQQQLRQHGHATDGLRNRPIQLVLVQLDVTDLVRVGGRIGVGVGVGVRARARVGLGLG